MRFAHLTILFAAAALPLAAQSGDGTIQSARQLPRATVVHPAAEGLQVPVAPQAIDTQILIDLVNNAPWCQVEENMPVELILPTSLPPAEAGVALVSLMYRETSWSLSHVIRAIELLGQVSDPIVEPLLVFVIDNAQTLVAIKSADIARRVPRAELQQFQQFLATQTREVQVAARNQLPRQ